jgi:methionine aminotransferase
MKNFTSKLPNVGTTIFTVMSGLANEYQAINLSQGFPNFPVDEKLINSVSDAMRKGFNQYAPMAGVKELREAISKKTEKLYGVHYCPEREITLTCGATEAVFDIITTLVMRGDEVIVLEPAYDSYLPAIELAGGVPVCVPLRASDFSVDWQSVENAISEKTKLLIYNTPHNPSGSNWKPSDMQNLLKIARNRDFFILADEVYEHIAFTPHITILREQELRKRAFAVYSFGKTFHATGWRAGYCIADADLTKEFRKVHQYVTFSIATPFQYALADYLQDENNYLSVSELFRKKRDFFCDLLSETRFRFTPAEGTYFQTASFAEISEESDLAFAERLVKEYGVATVPLSPFYRERTDNKIIRFCFAKTDETLLEAVKRLKKV